MNKFSDNNFFLLFDKDTWFLEVFLLSLNLLHVRVVLEYAAIVSALSRTMLPQARVSHAKMSALSRNRLIDVPTTLLARRGTLAIIRIYLIEGVGTRNISTHQQSRTYLIEGGGGGLRLHFCVSVIFVNPRFFSSRNLQSN